MIDKKYFFFLVFLLVLTFLSLTSADVLSVNSGGDNQLIINPDNWIEGFFSKPNLLPFAFNLILSSSNSGNTTNENLTISYSATDADGDPITNITDWRVNGNSIAVLNMPFDKNVAELTSGAVRDYSSYGNNGTLGGGTKANAPTWNSSCQVGGCYEFDGEDDYVFLENSFSGAETISLWVNFDKISSVSYFVGSKTLGGSNRGIRYSGSTFLVYGGPGYTSLSWTKIDSLVHFVTVRVNQTSFYDIYINGENLGRVDSGDSFSNTFIEYLGKRGDGYHFNGSIDEVMIFDRALSEEQIQKIYQAGLAGHQVEKMVSQETEKGDSWQVALTPNDAIMDGKTIYSNILEIIDSAPEDPSSVTLVSINGTNESDDDLNCSAYIQDVDNELLDVYVEWFKNDVSVLNYNFDDWANGTTFSMILDSGNLTLGDVWYCSVRTYDGNDYSSWVDSNELEVIDSTSPDIIILSPLSNELYNYTTLEVDFNISVIENEEVSMCFYSLEGAANVTMNELNNSYFWYEPSLGPGPQTVEFYCNDGSGNWGYNFTTFEILDEAAIAIDLSDELDLQVRWNIINLPVDNLDAEGNNGTDMTEYWVNISAENTFVDLYVRADGDLINDALDILGLENETFAFAINDPFVSNLTNLTMKTNYILIGSNLDNFDSVYLKFFLDAPVAQPAGEYINNLDFKAVRAGQFP